MIMARVMRGDPLIMARVLTTEFYVSHVKEPVMEGHLWWPYKAGGLIRQVVLQARWSYKAGGLMKQVVLLGRWIYWAGGLIRQVVL